MGVDWKVLKVKKIYTQGFNWPGEKIWLNYKRSVVKDFPRKKRSLCGLYLDYTKPVLWGAYWCGNSKRQDWGLSYKNRIGWRLNLELLLV